MIAQLRGQLVARDLVQAVIDCGGVGYGVAMSLPSLSRLGAPGAEVCVLVHTHVAEDALRLYGFADAQERDCFEVLIGTTGVGPRLALAILSTLSAAELGTAVQANDKLRLIRIPGVGPKKAERLMLELKGRLKPALAGPAGSPSALRQDLLSALLNLGFAPVVAERAARSALERHPKTQDVALLVRAALQTTK